MMEALKFAFTFTVIVLAIFGAIVSFIELKEEKKRTKKAFHNGQNVGTTLLFYGSLAVALGLLSPYLFMTSEERRQERYAIELQEEAQEREERSRKAKEFAKMCEEQPYRSDCRPKLTKKQSDAVFELQRQSDCIILRSSQFGQCD